MAIPKRIEEKAARADELIKQQAEKRQGASAEKKVEAPAQEQAPAAQAQEPVQNPTPPTQSSEDWENKYRILQGKYNAEVPRLQSKVTEQAETITTLTSQLRDAEGQLAQRQVNPEASIDLSNLTEEERETYGEDFLRVVAKVAARQAATTAPQPQATKVDPKLEERLKRVESDVFETKEDRFFKALKDKVPNWEALNTDARFLNWLAEQDPFSGSTRQELFNAAYARLDVDRIANFFIAFGVGGNQSNVSRGANVPPLESQVVPKTNSPVTAPQQGAKIWTKEEIAAFYEDVRTNRYRGKEQEAARIEEDIFAAQREGRVRK